MPFTPVPSLYPALQKIHTNIPTNRDYNTMIPGPRAVHGEIKSTTHTLRRDGTIRSFTVEFTPSGQKQYAPQPYGIELGGGQALSLQYLLASQAMLSPAPAPSVPAYSPSRRSLPPASPSQFSARGRVASPSALGIAPAPSPSPSNSSLYHRRGRNPPPPSPLSSGFFPQEPSHSLPRARFEEVPEEDEEQEQEQSQYPEDFGSDMYTDRAGSTPYHKSGASVPWSSDMTPSNRDRKGKRRADAPWRG
ncbi:hypothetical protein PLICRDRAFT_45835 [Plicaturopsis crispa FD-325 SS-3]|uniref:Uncharacterized protein n=1 Tax=Plicaturopsis crispa FD-325 SS-3 TaxID=944288 RepID=A0A0C9T9N6_PLICR|nr:hypothetical protein PLICRDRAFT_45835 [Plicaturopsis crispa FD-325 SS-3]